jgi:hypothetical protein
LEEEKWYGEEMGAPGELPTAAVMRLSKAAASRLCFPLRECPVMLTAFVSTPGRVRM